jgi:hypothetical protein
MRFLIALTIFLVFLEVEVRWVVGAPRAERLPLLRVRPDPQLGYTPMPNDTHYGYDQRTRLNSLGMRGPDVGKKEGKEYRILVLGETQLYGLGLADGELLTSVLQGQLRKRKHPQRRCRVINLGVRPFTLDQQLALLKSKGLDLEPDHVIVFFYIFSFRKIDILRYYQRVRHRDWYMLDLGGKPRGALLLKWQLIQLARKSAFIAWLHSLYKDWQIHNTLRDKLLRGLEDEEVAERLAYVRDQLGQFKELGSRHDFSLSLGAIPMPAQLAHDFPRELYLSELQKMASSLKIPFFDFLPPLREFYEESGRLPVAPFDEHYDATAHNIMAMHLATRFHSCGG